MHKLLIILVCFISIQSYSIDDPKLLIRALNNRFAKVNDYKANVNMQFDIPGVKMNNMTGKVFFKKPDKFKIRTKGIFFLPKQNPMQNMSAMLLDTNSYTSIISSYETVQGKKCAVVNIIPLKAVNDLVLGKFWVDISNPQILKTQITTKNSGTIESENYYSTFSNYNLPNQVVIRVELKKIRMSKLISADLNKKSTDKSKLNQLETGTIVLSFSDYQLNTRFPDSEVEAEN